MIDDLFSSYGAEAAPARRDDRADRQLKAPSKLDLKFAEAKRLSNAYRAMKRQERSEILKSEPRLLDFIRYLRKLTADSGDELLEAIRESWLPASAGSVRYFALTLVGRKVDKIRQSLGLQILDDDLPEHLGGPPGVSVFFAAREILVPGGRA